MKTITFITGNKHKAEIIQEFCDVPLNHQKLDLPEVQTLSVKEAAESKAEVAYALLRKPVLVEDVALTFSALKKLPGPFIKWFLETLGNKGLCNLIQSKDRSAKVEVVYALYDGKTMKTFSGVKHGTISKTPKGSNNFGWDPIFIPKGKTKTFAQMSKEEKHQNGHRLPALKKLKKFLNK